MPTNKHEVKQIIAYSYSKLNEPLRNLNMRRLVFLLRHAIPIITLLFLYKKRRRLLASPFNLSVLFRLPSALPLPSLRFDCMIFMNSRITEASTVSCKSGNKNTFFFCILFCLLPKFLGVTISYISFISFKAIDRSPAVAII
ncbi:hypothetical protein HRI_004525700 [Hibiscus trionum]|uniref:Uncharacterized protein n=1 Tax=Hibiscus trionum TaxID=183268 RepID=A0A9W7J739_HIBTR|nr:hypothetical protein HRI_004525700 [Hibiscus trionum]